MSITQNIREIRRLMKGDIREHAGDIAVWKADLWGLNARPALRSQLAPVRGWLPKLELDDLLGHPAGSFGRVYGEFLRDHGLKPFVLSGEVPPEVVARNVYGVRYATTHDMFHVLLGYGPDWVGELGVLAFTVGQGYNATLWVQAVAAWAYYPWLTGFDLRGLSRAWARGYALGRRAPFLLGVRLEDRLAEPLTDVRASLGLG